MFVLAKCPSYMEVFVKREVTVHSINCGRQEKHAILISGLLLRMGHMYVASIRLDLH